MRASKKVKGAVLLSAGAALVLGAPSVHADSSADNNNGLLGGLNLLNDTQLNVPVTVGGAGVLGVGEGENTVTTRNSNRGGSGSGSANTGGSSSSANNNNGLVGGVNAGNNLQANVPVTVCGVGALLARGEGECDVTARNRSGGGSSSANGNNGLVGGVNALNNAQLNVPVTVCGLAVLGEADASCEVEATNNTGGGTDGDVGGVDREDRDQGSSVRGATLPHTGAAGLALIPFGLALVAGGVALRRRVGAES